MRFKICLRTSAALALVWAGESVLSKSLRAQTSPNPSQALIRVDEAEVPEAVLFAFDDNSIPFFDNLQLSMEPPEKYRGNPVMPIGEAGQPDEWELRYYGTVIHIGEKYMMWYNAASRDGFVMPLQGGREDFRGWRFAYAESKDGIHWIKPSLGLVEFRGSRNNNLVQLPDGFRGYDSLVLHEPEERDPTRRFKMLAQVRLSGELAVPGGVAENGFIPLYSADGLRWRVADELVRENPKRIPSDFHLVTRVEAAGLYKWQGMYYLSGQAIGPNPAQAATVPYGRHVQIWHSSDFIHWSETQTMGFARQGQFRPPVGSSGVNRTVHSVYQGEQTHEGASVWNRGNVLIGLTGFWRGDDDWTKVSHPLGFLVSNDGLHFREPQPDFIFAEVGERGRDWDYGGLAQGQGFEEVGDKTYIWYGAPMDQSQGDRTGRPIRREGGVGLLVLDRDRFGSLSTRDPDRDGTLITSEIEAAGPVRLWVNAEGLGPDSPLRLELLDRMERPLPAYSGNRAAVVEKPGLRAPVSWADGNRIVPNGQPFKIRARLQGPERNAIRLYALYIGP